MLRHFPAHGTYVEPFGGAETEEELAEAMAIQADAIRDALEPFYSGVRRPAIGLLVLHNVRVELDARNNRSGTRRHAVGSQLD